MMKQCAEELYALFGGDGYVFELVLAVSAFGWRMPRRRFFIGRALGVTAALLAVSMAWNRLGASSAEMACIKNILLVVLAVPGVRFCLDVEWTRALFGVTAAAAAQHLSFKVGQTAASLARMAGLERIWAEMLVYPLGFGGALGLCWLVFGRRMARMARPRNNRSTLLLLLAVQLSTNLMQNLFLLEPALAGRGLYYLFQLYGILVCLFILSLQWEMVSRQAAQQDNRLLNQLIYQQKQQLDVRREVIGVINARCHELKQQTAALRGLVPPQQLEALRQAVEAYDTAVDTGSEPLNVLLAEKRLICKSKQIPFEAAADGRALAFLRTSDLYALLGNILDNAVTAAEKTPRPQDRYIRLEVFRKRGMTVIHCENSCSPGPLPDLPENLPDRPGPAGHHGFGLRSIRSLAEQYGGFLKVSARDGVFRLNLLFPETAPGQFDAKK